MNTEATPRPTRVILFYAVPIGITTVASYVALFFWAPLSHDYPLVLVGLSPVFRNLLLAAPRVDVSWLFAVAVPRHFAPDPFFYLLGREYGHLAIEWMENNSPSAGKFARVMERLFAKVGPFALLIFPEPVVSTLAGAAKVPFPVFAVFNIAGTIGTVFVARWLGDIFAKPITAIVAFAGAHWVPITAATILLVLYFNWYSRREGPETADKDTDRADL